MVNNNPEMLAEFAANVAADVEAMLPRFVGGFNRGDERAKAVTRELLERADPRPSAATLATGLDWLRDVDLRTVAPGPAGGLSRLCPRPLHFRPGRLPGPA